MATLAGLVLVIVGLLVTLVGGFLTFFGGRLFQSPFATDTPGGISGGFTLTGAVILVTGILHLLSGIFVWAHRSWARYLGLVLGALGVLLGIVSIVSSTGSTSSQQIGLVTGLVILVAYALVLVGLIMGGRHFRKERIG